MQHITVLQKEAVDGLALTPDSVVVDATFGSGGHAREIITRLGAEGCYIGIDADDSAFAGKDFKEVTPTIHLVNENFRNIKNTLRSLHISHIDALLADLGWRMEQFSEGGKGFSFQIDEPLHMTFGEPSTYEFTADTIVNEWGEESIADIIFGYGEERFSRRIAKAIVTAREVEPIVTTKQLTEVIASALPRFSGSRKINPATKTFQALRIAVNDELGALETLLKDGFEVLKPGGHMAIITFHSLEDRVVKHYFRTLKDAGLASIETKKPTIASSEELRANPRARSAKLRIIRKSST